MARARKPTADAIAIIHARYFAGRPERLAELEAERVHAAIARSVLTLRERAGLTQADLARRVGTSASVISRLEDADFAGHSLSMLRRIAAALGRRVEVRFVRTPRRPATA